MAVTLKKGDKGENVKTLQKALGVTVDGDFGAKTEAAVKAFQKSNGLTVDGIVGPLTQKALGISFDTTETITIDSYGIDITMSPLSKNITSKSRTIQYIVIHYTAGSSSAKGKAMDVRDMFNKGTQSASADFVVDDETIIQCNPSLSNYYCWAVGDGNGKNGITNTNSVSIEMCSTLKSGTSSSVANHSGWSISDNVLENTVKLTKYLMEKLNLSAGDVVRHYDASGKYCPGVVGWNDGTLYDATTGKSIGEKNNSDEWEKFKEEIK